jgi:hypothetical protein
MQSAFYIFLMMLVGYREPDGLSRYQRAIESATSDPEERRALGTIGRTENYFHLGSHTPPFGLTWETEQRRLRCNQQRRRIQAELRRHPDSLAVEVECDPPFTIETGAVFALQSMRALRRTCQREVPHSERTLAGRWAMAMGRYHHGTGGAHHGCWEDPLALLQIRWMSTTPPSSLPRHTIFFRTHP